MVRSNSNTIRFEKYMEINHLQPGPISTNLAMITGEHVATVETIKLL